MAKSRMENVREHLVAMMERLNDESLTPEKMEQAIEGAKALQGLSKAYTENARLTFQVARAVSEGDVHSKNVPEAFVDRPALEHKSQ